MAEFDSKKFVFHELFTNTNGKQSSSGFMGTILGLIAGAAFITCMVGYWFQIPNTLEVMGEVLKLVAASSLLLGVRKIAGRIGNNKNEDDNGEEEETTPSERYSDDCILETPKKG